MKSISGMKLGEQKPRFNHRIRNRSRDGPYSIQLAVGKIPLLTNFEVFPVRIYKGFHKYIWCSLSCVVNILLLLLLLLLSLLHNIHVRTNNMYVLILTTLRCEIKQLDIFVSEYRTFILKMIATN